MFCKEILGAGLVKFIFDFLEWQRFEYRLVFRRVGNKMRQEKVF